MAFSIISVLRIRASSLSAHPPHGLFLGLLISCLALRTSKNTYLNLSENGFEQRSKHEFGQNTWHEIGQRGTIRRL